MKKSKYMINKKFWLGILVMVFGMMVVGCDDNENSNNSNKNENNISDGSIILAGTWVSGSFSLTFGTSGSVSFKMSNGSLTGSVSGNRITLAGGHAANYTISGSNLIVSSPTGMYGAIMVKNSPYRKR
jgi:hypothetical protein